MQWTLSYLILTRPETGESRLYRERYRKVSLSLTIFLALVGTYCAVYSFVDQRIGGEKQALFITLSWVFQIALLVLKIIQLIVYIVLYWKFSIVIRKNEELQGMKFLVKWFFSCMIISQAMMIVTLSAGMSKTSYLKDY